ncbi:hypothetical protein BGZ61DRAFT_472463 [Ilyonectria robusta]|uniref:uncharacterized protein n=1 Tax=Ilyonectria robusta TaxID=1079257 RepID=UPI001E8D3DC2|nr:uncharacterized protein BGZ61DRAFT_472463 [Ilyonectria robusta]KAH8736101.1 hypothetical protein BGZ61DRAFT_472463 [Ilyonectria robusta]
MGCRISEDQLLHDTPDENFYALARSFGDRWGLVRGSNAPPCVVRNLNSTNVTITVQVDDYKVVFWSPRTASNLGVPFPETRQNFMTHWAILNLLVMLENFPSPKILDWNPYAHPLLEAPYICMTHLPGQRLSDAWFDKSNLIPLEQRRLRTLQCIAEAIATLSNDKEYTRILSSNLQPESHYLQTDVENNGDSTEAVLSSPNFCTDRESFNLLFEDNGMDGAQKFALMMSEMLPITDSPASFVLRTPCLEMENILVDEEGSIAGLLHWEGTTAWPAWMGSTYPAWICQDVVADMDGYKNDLSHETALEYRRFFRQQLNAKLEDPDDRQWCKASHIRRLIWLAATDVDARPWICASVLAKLLGIPLDTDEDYSKHRGELAQKLAQMGSPDYPEEDFQALRVKFKAWMDSTE